MRVINEEPPWADRIYAAFPAAKDLHPLFAWGDCVYQPKPYAIPIELARHEMVHMQRQLAMGVEIWWNKYIEDQQFRLDEEVLAHRVEYQSLCSRNRNNAAVRRQIQLHVAMRLRGEIYNYKPRLELHRARRLIVSA